MAIERGHRKRILDELPTKWGLQEMVAEIYDFLPSMYKASLRSVSFTEPNRLNFLWEDMYNDDKDIRDANGRWVGTQYLRMSDFLSIMNRYINVITFDMNSFGYANMNFTETGTTDGSVELDFEFEIEPHQSLDFATRTQDMKRKLSKMKRQMRR